MNNINTITVVLEGELTAEDLALLSERIRKAIHGEALNAKSGPTDFKSCDGINIKDWICIGSSK
jgi:hypothetical protein